MSTLAVLTTLFGIAISTRLSIEQLEALKAHPTYFIHPVLKGDVFVSDSHAYGRHYYGSLTNILNIIPDYGSFEESQRKVVYSEEVEDPRTGRMVRQSVEEQHAVPVFVQRSRAMVKGVRHSATIEYHCYHPRDPNQEQALVDFYHHTQPTAQHDGDHIFTFRDCQMRIKWAQAPGQDKWLYNILQALHIRKANAAKRIWYLTNRARELVPLRNYEFWRSHENMFHPDVIHQYDQSFVFHPVILVHADGVEDPCNVAMVMQHPGIILVDNNWRDGGYLKRGCLEHIHLKNIKNQWLARWDYVKPLELHQEGLIIGNKIPNPAATVVESSVEVIKRTRGAPEIKWKQGQIRGSYMREYEIESVDDCVCPDAPSESDCSGFCTKKLYLLPSFHSHEFSAENLQRCVTENKIQYLLTELDTERFELLWNDGDYSDATTEVWTACKLAIDPRNGDIKKLVLADLEPFYMYNPQNYNLLVPHYPIYHVWKNYYFHLCTKFRDHALVKTLTGVVSEMQQAESVALPIGMTHYDPLDPYLLDQLFPVDETKARLAERGMVHVDPVQRRFYEKQRQLMAEKRQHVKRHTLFGEYFGQGIKDLLLNPKKVRNVYEFRVTDDQQDIWTTNHKNSWN